MSVWMKKMLFLSVALTAMYLCVGWGTAVMPIDPLAHSVVATTVNPLYQVGCPSDSGIPAWECTMWSQQNNNNTAMRNGIISGQSSTALGRVVDGGPIVLDDAGGDGGLDSSYTGYVTYSPSSTGTRLVGVGNGVYTFLYGTTGAFTGTEVLRCHGKNTYSDGTTYVSDGGSLYPDFTMDGGSNDTGGAGVFGLYGPAFYPKNGVYISSVGLSCMTDAGASDVGITFTLYTSEM